MTNRRCRKDAYRRLEGRVCGVDMTSMRHWHDDRRCRNTNSGHLNGSVIEAGRQPGSYPPLLFGNGNWHPILVIPTISSYPPPLFRHTGESRYPEDTCPRHRGNAVRHAIHHETTVRLHPRQQAQRHAVRRGNFQSRPPGLATQARHGGGLHQTVRCPHVGLVRTPRHDGPGNCEREAPQGMETRVETGPDRKRESDVARPVPGPDIVSAGFRLSPE